jgi:hypothetical protein
MRSVLRGGAFPGSKKSYQRRAFLRLTPRTMRSTRHVLVSRERAALAGVMPRRATSVQT